ncbi:MAG: SAM-dependent chlorinase/fluorinase [Thermodesulfovibrionales bacterium]
MKNRRVLRPSGVITLTTDFGLRDTFVGQMKGVILSINRCASIVDITHEIEQYSVDKANYLISGFYRYFPPKTIHVGIVDPGVGSMRRGLIIDYDGHFFIGPDNGIFSSILRHRDKNKVVQITNTKYTLRSHSPTFQGRDVFAPVAGWLSIGIPIDDFGSPIDDPVVLDLEVPRFEQNEIHGRVVLIDRFGNCITNIKSDHIKDWDFEVVFRDKVLEPSSYYEESRDKGISCIINSSGFLELFVYRGSASKTYDIKESQPITVRLLKNRSGR